MFYMTKINSPLGQLELAADGKAICGLWFQHQKYEYGTLPEIPVERDDLPVLQQGRDWLCRYFAGEKPEPGELPLAPIGNEFRQAVWRHLLEIPYGQVTTYGEIAGRIAAERGLDRMSAQAVGGAVGHNPIGIIIPCHRVVGANGNLTGYAGGIEIKKTLLEHEGLNIGSFFIPKK